MNASAAFRRVDESADRAFYVQPRLVAHIDDLAIAAVTQLYREIFRTRDAVLDLMSSWISHLPPEIAYRSVTGLGMNATELAANARLDSFVVHDLNAHPAVPFDDGRFDAVGCCVSIQYLTQPVDVMRDLARVCRPNAPLVITFSNRCFPTKAVAAWRMLDDRGHAALVAGYLRDAGGWDEVAAYDRSAPGGDPLYAVVTRRTSDLLTP